VISLCNAFLAVRDTASWHDQTHRNHIAIHLMVAADAIEKFMPAMLQSSLMSIRWPLSDSASKKLQFRCGEK
jgi:hypothetical protein